MSLKKRHIGRRVAGVGVAAALLVLGLQAPASAAVTITGIAPASGPDNCLTVITGTGFQDFIASQMDVDFVNAADASSPNDADFAVISDTIIWANVPVGTDAGVSYTVRVTNPANAPAGVTSTATFLNTAAAGACAPTITSFTPTCGPAGTTVVITGTNLIDGPSLLGGLVAFPPYGGGQVATHTVPDVDDVTSLSVIVPSGSGDGPIFVATTVGTAFSSANFLVPPPDCTPVTTPEHARAITFKITKKGKASGVVSSTEDPAFTECAASVPVKIQRKKTGGGWKTLTTATTSDTGSYSAKVKNKSGKQKFRAIATKVSLGDPVTDICLKARSATRTA